MRDSEQILKQQIQKDLDSPMPWIGMYVAAASLLCSVAMAGDVIHGIRRKKLWFPCKYFTMNAASLTVLAVAMKLPVDLNTVMWGTTDTLAKLSGIVFMITVMGNFLTSFAVMNDNESLMNIMALGILVITIIVNVGVQLNSLKHRYSHYGIILNVYEIVSMLVLFVTLSSSVLTVTTTKRHMEWKYNELHKTICEAEKLEETEKLTHHKLKEVVEKYWVMAETGSPQFVMARSATAAFSGAICLLNVLPLVKEYVFVYYTYGGKATKTATSYHWSTSWILYIQSIGVVVGTIAPICRWFTCITFNCNNIFTKHHLKELKSVETYWIQKLVEWKETPLPLLTRGMKCKKVIGNLKILVLNMCICVQIGIVVASKLVYLTSIIITLPLFSCFYFYKRMKVDTVSESSASTNNGSSEPENSSPELDLYVLRLEGEAKLPKIIVKNICHELNQVIQKGRSQQPKNLKELLRKSNNNLKGVVDFDNTSHVPNCWTMPVVNLTSIAIALPNIESHSVDHLICSVSEGLLYAGLVDECFSSKGDNMINWKCVANVVWEGIELNRKWLDRDLRKLRIEGKTIEWTLQTLVDIAEKAAIEFERSVTGGSKVLAANSMYRISQTILKDYDGNKDASTDGNLFEQLSIMIADILGACLLNLPRVITKKCYRSAIEEREKSVSRAACLMGETEEILEILEHKQLPCLIGDRVAYIDEWRAYMMQKDPLLLFLHQAMGYRHLVLVREAAGELWTAQGAVFLATADQGRIQKSNPVGAFY